MSSHVHVSRAANVRSVDQRPRRHSVLGSSRPSENAKSTWWHWPSSTIHDRPKRVP